MTAGRGLDAVIANQVMGWKIDLESYCTMVDEDMQSLSACTNALIELPKPLNIIAISAIRAMPKTKEVRGWPPLMIAESARFDAGEKIIPVVVPPYSTEIALAWSVVEKLKSKDFILERGPEFDWQWKATFDRSQKWCVADTAPHAICLAALAVVS